jgi:hypothetical protein
MSLLLQDVVATGMALGAIVVLYRRIAGVVAPPPGKDGCTACPTCPSASRGRVADHVPAEPFIQIVTRPR